MRYFAVDCLSWMQECSLSQRSCIAGLSLCGVEAAKTWDSHAQGVGRMERRCARKEKAGVAQYVMTHPIGLRQRCQRAGAPIALQEHDSMR